MALVGGGGRKKRKKEGNEFGIPILLPVVPIAPMRCFSFAFLSVWYEP